MHRILAFFVLALSTNQCFSNLEDYVEREFERNREQYGCIKDLDFGFKSTNDFMKLSEIGLNFIVEKQDDLNSLESLNLSGNNIPEIVAHDFIEKLVILTPNLKKINLSFNRIGFMGASIIGNVCHQWEHLEALYLCHANINSDGLLSLFIKLSKHPNLKHLDIASNAFFNEESAYKLGHRFAAFQNLNSISFEDLGLNDALMDAFLLGMDHYKMSGPECVMPLKSVHFGNNIKSLDSILKFMSKLDHAYQLNFYCQKKKYTINKENHTIKSKEKYFLKIYEQKSDKNIKMVKGKQIIKLKSNL
ncbi:MAG: hypothetical protein Q8S31_05725 [Alphaproteobacteria bacterium]|nr:hypothetical protein [Alphaproteobacteria bacterium]